MTKLSIIIYLFFGGGVGCKAIWRIVRTSEKILATPLDKKKKYPVEPRVTEVLSGMAQVGEPPPWPKGA